MPHRKVLVSVVLTLRWRTVGDLQKLIVSRNSRPVGHFVHRWFLHLEDFVKNRTSVTPECTAFPILWLNTGRTNRHFFHRCDFSMRLLKRLNTWRYNYPFACFIHYQAKNVKPNTAWITCWYGCADDLAIGYVCLYPHDKKEEFGNIFFLIGQCVSHFHIVSFN